MKKLLLGIFIFASLIVSTPKVHAVWVSDSIMKEILEFRASLGATAFDAYPSRFYGYGKVSDSYDTAGTVSTNTNTNTVSNSGYGSSYGSGYGSGYSTVVTPVVVQSTPVLVDDSSFSNYSGTDRLTPRVMFSVGKYDQHFDLESKSWKTDPKDSLDGYVNKLDYCKKWYPDTESVRVYKQESINTWKYSYKTDKKDSVKSMSYECLKGMNNNKKNDKNNNKTNTLTLTYPKSGDTLNAGDVINVLWKSGMPEYANLTIVIRSNGNIINRVDTLNDGNEIVKIPVNTPAGQYDVEVSNGSIVNPIVYANLKFYIKTKIIIGDINNSPYVITNPSNMSDLFAGKISNNGQKNINDIFSFHGSNAWFEYSKNSDLSDSLKATVSQSAISMSGDFTREYSDLKLSPDTKYYYRACAASVLGTKGLGTKSSPFCGSIVSFVTPKASGDSSVVTITYSANTGGTITGTKVQNITSGGNGTTVTAVPNTGYTFSSWDDGLKTATRTDKNVTASKTIIASFTAAVGTVPSPTNLAYTCNATNTLVTLTWTAPSGYTKFLTRASKDTFESNDTVLYDNNVIAATDSFEVLPNTTYYAWVHTAGNNSDFLTTGNFSEKAMVKVNCITTSLIPTLSSPTATNITQTSATLGATLVAVGTLSTVNKNGIIYYGTIPNAKPTLTSLARNTLTPISLGAYTINVDGLTCGTKYYYYGAYSGSNLISEQGYSPEGSFTTLACTVNTTPSITIISPNGGETYQAGQKITVKWKTNSVPINAESAPYSDGANTYIDIKLLDAVTNYDYGLNIRSDNDGEETITLPAINIISGKNFKIKLSVFAYASNTSSSKTLFEDSSDNFFTINSLVDVNSVPVMVNNPDNPTSLKVNELGTFTFKATDLNNDKLAYNIKWGDGTSITSYCDSIGPYVITHAWSKPGTYNINVEVGDHISWSPAMIYATVKVN